MPPLLLRRRPAPAQAPQPQVHSLSDTVSEVILPRSLSDKPALSSLPESQPRPRFRAASLAPLTHTTRTEQLGGADAISAATRVSARQDAEHTPSTIPGGYGGQGSGPDPGTVVGITVGAVGGFIVFLWILYWCINFGRTPVDYDATSTVSMGTASVLQRRRRSSHASHHRHHHHHRSPRRETVEVRTSRRPYIVGEGGVREVLVEETTRGVSRGPPPVVPPAPRVVTDEDEVVVIEENSPPRRHRSHRSSSRRRDSSYRDPRVRRSSGSRR